MCEGRFPLPWQAAGVSGAPASSEHGVTWSHSLRPGVQDPLGSPSSQGLAGGTPNSLLWQGLPRFWSGVDLDGPVMWPDARQGPVLVTEVIS